MHNPVAVHTFSLLATYRGIMQYLPPSKREGMQENINKIKSELGSEQKHANVGCREQFTPLLDDCIFVMTSFSVHRNWN